MIKLQKQFVYRVKEEDDICYICKIFNTCKENILRNNNNIPLYAGELIEIKVNDYISHIVKPAESLKTICEEYNICKDDVIITNNLKTEKLYIGQMLKIYK